MNRTSPISELEEPCSPTQEHPSRIGGRFVQGSALDRAIAASRSALTGVQSEQGYWLFELEADCTIPAEYILMQHFLGELDPALEAKLANYLRSHQAAHGGWPLYQGGALDISCTVKAYYALKLAGDSPGAPHMVRAREAILARGGAARANVFTRIALALFGQVPWRAVPYIPVEIMLLPRWFPFHLDKVSYWSRTVMVPLFILCTRRPRAKNPREVDVAELFVTPPEEERDYFPLPQGRARPLARAFLLLDRCARRIDPLIPKPMRRAATRRAESWVIERLNGEDGLGAIFPAMVNALEAFAVLGYPADDPRRVIAKRALEKLLVVTEAAAYCQPCVSPVWDTALATLAMQEEGGATAVDGCEQALEWLRERQLLDQPGDWQRSRPDLPGGGWAFQFANSFYPDLDDTAVIVWAMRRARDPGRYADRVERALDWLVGMQSSNGGFAAFDVDNVHYRLNYIPFADHGALLDPPTERRHRTRGHGAGPGRPATGPQAPAAGHRVPAPGAGGRRLLVRPLGDQLHLRHLVGADGAGAGARAARGSGPRACRVLAEFATECRWRLGREQRQLRAGPVRAVEHGQHLLPDRLGAAWPDGRRPGEIGGRAPWHRLPRAEPERRRLLE